MNLFISEAQRNRVGRVTSEKVPKYCFPFSCFPEVVYENANSDQRLRWL